MYQEYQKKVVCLADCMADRAVKILQKPELSEADLKFLQLAGEMAEYVWRLYNY